MRAPLAAGIDPARGAGRARVRAAIPDQADHARRALRAPAATSTSARASCRPASATRSASRSSSRTAPAPAALIAGDYVARSAPDGHTLFVGSNGPIMLGPMTMPKPPYQWDKVFAPVSTLAVATNMLLVTPKLPVKTVAELVDYAKKNPGKLTLATSSGASINHFMAELLKLKTGITWTEVHYRGNAPAINDLIAGHVDVGLHAAHRLAAAHRGRHAPRAGGAGAEARAGRARRADHRRGRLARRAGHHLQRPVRAEGARRRRWSRS